MAETKTVETKVEKVEVNLDISSTEHQEQTPLHSQKMNQKNLTYLVEKDVDMSFIDKPTTEETKKEEPEATEETSEVVEEKGRKKKLLLLIKLMKS